MDLYTPLYVPRPVVVPELFASLRPVAYSGAMGEEREKLSAKAGDAAPYFETAREKAGKDGKVPPMRGAGGAYGLAGAAPATPAYADSTRRELAAKLHLGAGVSAAASAARLGDFFQYALDRPVSLPRQKSALLPIVGKDVRASRVSIYNEAAQAKFPLLGLKFKNTSGLHLMQGPVTVFEGSTYAGDARILDLQPGEERLISYAVDLGTEVDPKPEPSSGRITQVRAYKGILHTTTKVREAKTYTVKNRNDQRRTVLVEHPVRADFTLIDTAKPAEAARDFYRFELGVPAGASRKLTVTEERDLGSAVQLASVGDEQVRFFLSQAVTSEKVKEGLRRALGLRHELAQAQREAAERERQLRVITDDQTRLRANLKDMPSTAKAYKRYLEKFDQQETQIETLQADIENLRAAAHARQKALDDFLAAFTAG
jgi:hypothetical protein